MQYFQLFSLHKIQFKSNKYDFEQLYLLLLSKKDQMLISNTAMKNKNIFLPCFTLCFYRFARRNELFS